jgi:hypothetical protein
MCLALEDVSPFCAVSSLCNSRLAFYSPLSNSSSARFFYRDVKKVLEIQGQSLNIFEGLLCGQILSTKQISCTKFEPQNQFVTLVYGGLLTGQNAISLMYLDAVKNNQVMIDLQSTGTFTIPLYFVPTKQPLQVGTHIHFDPPYGTIAANEFRLQLTMQDFEDSMDRQTPPPLSSVYQQQLQQRVQATGFVFDVPGVTHQTYPASLTYLASSDIEPASWFFSLTPTATRRGPGGMREDFGATEEEEAEEVEGQVSQGYIEFVLTSAQIAQQRRFVDPSEQQESLRQSQLEGEVDVEVEAVGEVNGGGESISKRYSCSNDSGIGCGDGESERKSQSQSQRYDVKHAVQQLYSTGSSVLGAGAGIENTTNTSDSRVNVCIWSSDTLDGQKRIWLQQLEHLDARRFRFTWLLTLSGGYTIAEKFGGAGEVPGADAGDLERRREEQWERTRASKDKGVSGVYAAVHRILAEKARKAGSSWGGGGGGGGTTGSNGVLVDSPFNSRGVAVDALAESPGDGRLPLSETWGRKELNLYKYVELFCCMPLSNLSWVV